MFNAIRSTPMILLCAALLGCHSRPAPPVRTEAPAPAPNPSGSPPEPSTAPPAVVETAPDAVPPEIESGPPSAKLERRCGWVDNPTPSNWWLTDRDGEWEIGIQGGYQAAGEMPDFRSSWVETSGHYGYGCACMNARVDHAQKRILEYRQVQVLPISRCKKDAKLPSR